MADVQQILNADEFMQVVVVELGASILPATNWEACNTTPTAATLSAAPAQGAAHPPRNRAWNVGTRSVM